MGELLSFNLIQQKQVIKRIGLPFDKVEDICESMKNIAYVIMYMRELAEKHLYEDLDLPAEEFTNVNISRLDIQGFLFEEKPIQVVYSGEIDGVPNRITTYLVKTKDKKAVMLIFTEHFDGENWIRYESDDFRFV